MSKDTRAGRNTSISFLMTVYKMSWYLSRCQNIYSMRAYQPRFANSIRVSLAQSTIESHLMPKMVSALVVS